MKEGQPWGHVPSGSTSQSKRAGIWPRLSSARLTHFNMDGKNLASDDEYKFLIHRGTAIEAPGQDCLSISGRRK
jgi:hypothetical protein